MNIDVSCPTCGRSMHIEAKAKARWHVRAQRKLIASLLKTFRRVHLDGGCNFADESPP